MKHTLALVLMGTSIVAFSQTLYVPGTTGASTNSNVGIGTSSPETLLDIKASSANQSLFRLSHPTSPTSAGFTIGFGQINLVDNDAIDFKVERSSVEYNVLSINRATRDFYYVGDGKVGIGTDSPQSLLDVTDESANAVIYASAFGGKIGAINLFGNTGTKAAPLPSPNDTHLGSVNFVGWDDARATGASIRGYADAGWGNSAYDAPGRLTFWTAPNGSSTLAERMTIRSSGNVGIGTDNPVSLLDVTKESANSTIYASAFGGIGQINLFGNTGTKATPLPSSNDTHLGSVNFVGWDNSRATGASIRAYADDEWGTGGVDDAPGRLSFWTAPNGSSGLVERMTILSDGRVGIGDQTPTAKLTIQQTGNEWNDGLRINRDVTNYLTLTEDVTDIRLKNWGSGGIKIFTATAEAMTISSGNNVGIGTSTPTERLSVNGTIRAKEIKVEASPWPDYVFEESYNLPTLEETKAYIEENKHLPEIPSAKEMEENGVALGEMNMLLLKKIEELTLYQIQMNEQLQNLSLENQAQQKEIERLKTRKR